MDRVAPNGVRRRRADVLRVRRPTTGALFALRLAGSRRLRVGFVYPLPVRGAAPPGVFRRVVLSTYPSIPASLCFHASHVHFSPPRCWAIQVMQRLHTKWPIGEASCFDRNVPWPSCFLPWPAAIARLHPGHPTRVQLAMRAGSSETRSRRWAPMRDRWTCQMRVRKPAPMVAGSLPRPPAH